MSINDFIHQYKLKNTATSNIKLYQVLSSLYLKDARFYLKDGLFESVIGIVNLHPSRVTHWILHIHESYFVSYGCPPPQKQSKKFYKTEWTFVYILNRRYKV